jgi:hypothetical protein
MGDWNDFDATVPDVQGSTPTSRVLKMLKDPNGDGVDELRSVAEKIPQVSGRSWSRRGVWVGAVGVCGLVPSTYQAGCGSGPLLLLGHAPTHTHPHTHTRTPTPAPAPAPAPPQSERSTSWYDAKRNGKVNSCGCGRSSWVCGWLCDTCQCEYSQIDHMLLTAGLWGRVTAAGIQHGHDPMKVSDHFPIWVTLNTA